MSFSSHLFLYNNEIDTYIYTRFLLFKLFFVVCYGMLVVKSSYIMFTTLLAIAKRCGIYIGIYCV